jgi:3-hydroxybutyryl-CoA dehydrogenase
MMYDISSEQLEKAKTIIETNLNRQAQKGTLAESDIPAIMNRIQISTRLEDLSSCDLVVEAVSENETLKLDLFRKLDALVKPDAILASNTSSISITKIAAVTKRPDQVVGLHFMNPVPVMKLVEIIRGHSTSDATFAFVSKLVSDLGKESAVASDYPAFIVNRILIPMINEAIFALYEGVGDAENIDRAMKLGTNQPIGPLALADLIGLDTCLSIMNVLYEGFKDPKYRPCPLLTRMVLAGKLGRKTGTGFYEYQS